VRVDDGLHDRETEPEPIDAGAESLERLRGRSVGKTRGPVLATEMTARPDRVRVATAIRPCGTL